MIKLIVTDLDGTLLDDNKNINPSFWEVQKQLAAQGVLFAIASGRQFYNLEDTFSALRNELLFLAENGTFVRYQNREILVNELDKPSATTFIRIARSINNAFPVLCGKESAYIEDRYEPFVSDVSRFFKRYQIVDDLTAVNDTVLKVSIFDFNDSATNTYPHYLSYVNDYNIAVSGPMWVDITSKTASKGAALEHIQQQLGISFDETMVFGDFLNDLEMMKAARYSFAMKNAHPDIIRASNAVTQFDNNHNGVVETIRQVCLSNG